jgi:hypothetical protein
MPAPDTGADNPPALRIRIGVGLFAAADLGAATCSVTWRHPLLRSVTKSSLDLAVHHPDCKK